MKLSIILVVCAFGTLLAHRLDIAVGLGVVAIMQAVYEDACATDKDRRQ